MTKRIARSSLPFEIHPDGCWRWTGPCDKDGYGRCSSGRLAHRVMYERLVGPIPEGLTIDHLCRVRPCVNPAHLEPVTLQENIARRPLTPDGGRSWNADITHCANGHPYDEANTYVRPSGWRDCRACIRDRVRRYKNRKQVTA